MMKVYFDEIQYVLHARNKHPMTSPICLHGVLQKRKMYNLRYTSNGQLTEIEAVNNIITSTVYMAELASFLRSNPLSFYN